MKKITQTGLAPYHLFRRKSGAGFSTVEMLIAFTIMTLGLSSAAMVAFGNQSLTIDTELENRALYVAERALEEARASAFANFNALASAFTVASADETFDKELTVTDVSECVKRIESAAQWTIGSRSQETSLTTVVVDPETSLALGHDCDTTEVEDEWDNPDIFVDEQITGQADATGIDVHDEYLYLTTSPGSANNQEEFFIYEFEEGPPITLTARGSIDFGKDSGSNKFGLNAVDIAYPYAFVASASSTAQLQVIDISDPDTPAVISKTGLSGVNPAGSYPGAVTLYYYDEKIYVGTKETAGPEFHIYDVDMSNGALSHVASLNLDHNVNDIMVQGDYAYIASSDDNHELMVININSGSADYMQHPDDTGFGFNAPGGGNHDGTAVYVLGDRVYLGREKASNNPPDMFVILDRDLVTNGDSLTDGVLGGEQLSLGNNGSYVSGIVVRGNFAFLALESSNVGFVIYNVSEPSDIKLPAECSEYNSQQHTIAIDMEGRYIFTANQHNADIQVVHDLEAACPL